MRRSVALAVAVAIIAAPSSVAAERPHADVTPGCVSWDEYVRAGDTASTHRDVRQVFRVHGRKRPNSLSTGTVTSPDRYVTFEYPGCAGAFAYVVYERPNKRHPKTREWVEMMWALGPKPA